MTAHSDDPKDSPAGTTAVAAVPRRLWLRRAVLVLALTESLLLLLYIGFIATMLWSSDPLSRAIGQAVLTLAAIPLVFVVPALIMGIVNCWLWVALLLLVVVVPAEILLFRLA